MAACQAFGQVTISLSVPSARRHHMSSQPNMHCMETTDESSGCGAVIVAQQSAEKSLAADATDLRRWIRRESLRWTRCCSGERPIPEPLVRVMFVGKANVRLVSLSTDLCAADWTARPGIGRRRITTNLSLNGSRKLLRTDLGVRTATSGVSTHTVVARTRRDGEPQHPTTSSQASWLSYGGSVARTEVCAVKLPQYTARSNVVKTSIVSCAICATCRFRFVSAGKRLTCKSGCGRKLRFQRQSHS